MASDVVDTEKIVEALRLFPCLWENDETDDDPHDSNRCWDRLYVHVLPNYHSLSQNDRRKAREKIRFKWACALDVLDFVHGVVKDMNDKESCSSEIKSEVKGRGKATGKMKQKGQVLLDAVKEIAGEELQLLVRAELRKRVMRRVATLFGAPGEEFARKAHASDTDSDDSQIDNPVCNCGLQSLDSDKSALLY